MSIILELTLIFLMGISTLVIFDFIVYTMKSAPKSSNFNTLHWVVCSMVLAGGVGYFILGW